MVDPANLLEILTLDGDPTDPDRFVGYSPQEPRRRVFGGQVVAQALVAATNTVPDGHDIHSLHAYFLRGGEVAAPITFVVERLRDGRAFSARRVTALQDDKAILVFSSSFHAGGAGGDYEPPAPVGIPGPDHLPPTGFARDGRLETRDASYDQPSSPHRRLWFRSGCELPEHLHAAAIAYATDHGPFGAARRVVDAGRGPRFDDLFRASLDHALWFHRRPRVDDWLLYDIEAVTHRNDRVLTNGVITDQQGRRIATVAQELLARQG